MIVPYALAKGLLSFDAILDEISDDMKSKLSPSK